MLFTDHKYDYFDENVEILTLVEQRPALYLDYVMHICKHLIMFYYNICMY